MSPSKEQTDLELAHKSGKITLDELIEQSAARGLPVAKRLQQSYQKTNLELALMRGEISLAELVEQSAALGLPVADYLLEPAQPRRFEPIMITAEQLAERDQWERQLMLGQITLVDCLDICMGIGVPATDYMRSLFAQAVEDYKDGFFADLAEPLGVAIQQRKKQAMARKALLSNMIALIDSAHQRGFPKTNPSEKGVHHYHDKRDEKTPAPTGSPSALRTAGPRRDKKDKRTAFHVVGASFKPEKSASTIFSLYHEALRLQKMNG